MMNQDQPYQYLFTVFTPTFNRAHTLHRVYNSLKVQTYRDFEWLIIDNGSTDNTSKLVEQWQIENQFSIRYIYQENGGKHIAFNKGVKIAKGELFVNLDSDDACVPNALERFKYHWDTIPSDRKEQFTAVTCLCQDEKGQLVGNLFPLDITDSDSLEIRYRFKVKGDKWGCHRTDILRKFPFPEQIQRTYIPECIVWKRIAREYKIRYVNEILRIYWTDQPSMVRGNNVASRNARGGRIAHLNSLNEDINWFLFAPLIFLRSAINYSRYSFHVEMKISEQFKAISTTISKTLYLIALPIGYIVYCRDKFLINNNY